MTDEQDLPEPDAEDGTDEGPTDEDTEAEPEDTGAESGGGGDVGADTETAETSGDGEEPDGPEEDAGTEREQRIEELEEREERIEELESTLRRVQADFQNYKKRRERQERQLRETATEDLVSRLVGVRDNLVRALSQDEEAEIRPGIESTLSEFDRVLSEEDVRTIEPEPGDEVDPQRHEVMMRVESDRPEGTVEELYTPGYEMGEKVLRAAQVTVSDGEETG